MADDENPPSLFWEKLQFTGELLIVLARAFVLYWYCVFKIFFPQEPKDVKGEIVLITGTGHGIGRELALHFSKLGSIVVCVDINEKGNKETVDMVKKTKAPVHQYQCDVTNREQVFALAAQVRREVGDVDILVNNAGIMPCRPILDHTEKEIRSMMEINVIGNLWMIQAFLPAMIERNHGHIVALSSMAGLMGIRNLVPYCGTKYAARGIMEALKVELSEDPRNLDGINLTTICPIFVDTGLCHKPRVKYPWLMNVVKTADAADQIVDAVRRNYMQITIPGDLFYSNKLSNIIPYPVFLLFNKFIDTGVDSHD